MCVTSLITLAPDIGDRRMLLPPPGCRPYAVVQLLPVFAALGGILTAAEPFGLFFRSHVVPSAMPHLR